MTARSHEPTLTAVVVTYQSERTVAQTLAKLREGQARGLLHCVVVDNASTDATRDMLTREASWAKILLEDVNHGFGSSCNIGAAAVETQYTVFVNPDAEVGPDAMRAMLAVLDANPRIGIVGPATTVGDAKTHRLQHTGPRPIPIHVLQQHTRLLGRVPEQHAIVPGSPAFRTGWVCGAVLMIRTSLLRQLGGFDPAFFLYWEEMDLCKRAEDAGFEVWAVGAAVAHHVCGVSSESLDATRIQGCIAEHYYQSRRHYLIKHHGWVVATATELAEFAILLLMTAVDIVRGRGAARIRPRLQARLFSRPRGRERRPSS